MHAAIDDVRDALDDADSPAARSGAGVSTASGIPDFRGDAGLWERYDPDAFAIHRFERDPSAPPSTFSNRKNGRRGVTPGR